MTIYLYVKTHRKTGLKYLGKTKQDPFKYNGSGIRWQNHLKVHGSDLDTEILHECDTNEEIKEWGIYYSKLWNIVENSDWANLKEEAGDGLTSEEAKQLQQKRVENGTHHFLDSNFQKRVNKTKIENGTHHFLGSEQNRKRIENGTHNFLGGEIQKKTTQERLTNRTHHFLGGEIQKKTTQERLTNGTHNFLGQNAPTQIKWTCEYCNTSGKHIGMFNRWHKNGKCQKF